MNCGVLCGNYQFMCENLYEECNEFLQVIYKNNIQKSYEELNRVSTSYFIE